MTRLIVCSLGLVAFLAAVQPASAAATQLLPGTGVPAPPGPSLPDLGAMPSEDELAVLYALSQLTWDELPVVLADLGLDRFWWENNIAIGVYSIPVHLPEGSAYNAFVEIEHLPSGDQIGCYLQTGTDRVVCVENWPSVSWYPLLLSPSDTLDLLFPLMAHHVAGTPVNDSYEWSCLDLRCLVLVFYLAWGWGAPSRPIFPTPDGPSRPFPLWCLLDTCSPEITWCAFCHLLPLIHSTW